MEFNYFDIIASVIILLLGLKGIINGFFKEVFGLIGIIGGIFIASRVGNEVGQYLSNLIFKFENSAAINFTGFLVALAVFWFFMIVVGYIFKKLSSVSGLGIFDRIFGFIFGPILSHLSDKFGRKPLLLISQIGTLIGFAILAISQNIYWVYVSRIVDGIFGGNFPIAKAIIGDVVDPIDRSREMTNVGTAHNLANLIGPAIGGILSKSTGLVGPGLIAAFLSFSTVCSVSNLVCLVTS